MRFSELDLERNTAARRVFCTRLCALLPVEVWALIRAFSDDRHSVLPDALPGMIPYRKRLRYSRSKRRRANEDDAEYWQLDGEEVNPTVTEELDEATGVTHVEAVMHLPDDVHELLVYDNTDGKVAPHFAPSIRDLLLYNTTPPPTLHTFQHLKHLRITVPSSVLILADSLRTPPHLVTAAIHATGPTSRVDLQCFSTSVRLRRLVVITDTICGRLAQVLPHSLVRLNLEAAVADDVFDDDYLLEHFWRGLYTLTLRWARTQGQHTRLRFSRTPPGCTLTLGRLGVDIKDIKWQRRDVVGNLPCTLRELELTGLERPLTARSLPPLCVHSCP